MSQCEYCGGLPHPPGLHCGPELALKNWWNKPATEVGVSKINGTFAKFPAGYKIPESCELTYKHPFWWDEEWKLAWDRLHNSEVADQPALIERTA